MIEGGAAHLEERIKNHHKNKIKKNINKSSI